MNAVIRPKRYELGFGAPPYIDILTQRIRQYFALNSGEQPTSTIHCINDNEALVIGLYGPWGCGKTRWLRDIQERFRPDGIDASEITLPVFFNAWRFEKEDHMIIPLLKTAEHELRNLEQYTTGDWLKERVKLLGESIIAIGSGLKLGFGLPLGPRLDIDFEKMLKIEKKRHSEILNSKKSILDEYESIYFNLVEHMLKLTGRNVTEKSTDKKILNLLFFMDDFIRLKKQILKLNGKNIIEKSMDKKKLNFLFLIDDLDRCLPEKALDMLESIKLFLEVPGCAFVLGIDDEVVERGVIHRYRDYLFHNTTPSDDKNARKTELPITGSEYLEKIVQLQIRIPQMNRRDAGEFLMQNYREVFSIPARHSPADQRDVNQLTGDVELEIPQEQEMREKIDRDLLELFTYAVPKIPRKLIRAIELFLLLENVASRSGLTRDSNFDRVMLARFVLLQLNAPCFFRNAVLKDELAMLYLVDWVGKPKIAIKEEIETPQTSQDAEELNSDEAKRIQIRREAKKPVVWAFEESLNNRSGFDPRTVLGNSPDRDSYKWENIRGYLALFPSEAGDEAGEIEPRRILETKEISIPVIPNDKDEFLLLATSETPADWEILAARGRKRFTGNNRLDDVTFKQLLKRVSEMKMSAEDYLPWLQFLETFLSADQILKIVQKANILITLMEDVEQ